MVDRKDMTYWWTGTEHDFKGNHKGDCEICGDEATLDEEDNPVCHDCFIIAMEDEDAF